MRSLKHIAIITIFTLLLLAQAGVASATETLIMDNGDRINGHLVRMSDGVLELETGYAGTIRVGWKHIRTIQSDDTFRIRLTGNEMVSVASLSRQNDRLLLDGRSEPFVNVMQINPADWETGDAGRFSGDIDAAFKLDRGNTHENRADITARVEWKKLQHRIRLGGEVEYSKIDGALSSDRWSIESSYDNNTPKRSFYGARTSLKSDRMTDLNLRSAIGPHLGVRIFDTARTSLSAETGFEYTSERYRGQAAEKFLAESWRLEFNHFLIPGKLEIYHRNNGLLGLTRSGGVSFDAWNGLKFPIAGGLNTSAEIKMTYDGDAPADAQSWDIVYRLKIGYQW
jgi:hypothetical protein